MMFKIFVDNFWGEFGNGWNEDGSGQKIIILHTELSSIRELLFHGQ